MMAVLLSKESRELRREKRTRRNSCGTLISLESWGEMRVVGFRDGGIGQVVDMGRESSPTGNERRWWVSQAAAVCYVKLNTPIPESGAHGTR